MNLCVGMLVRVKPKVWREWCIRHQHLDEHGRVKPFTPQTIISVPSHPPFLGYVMLGFPFYWWKEEELVEEWP